MQEFWILERLRLIPAQAHPGEVQISSSDGPSIGD
jgi:hypothetical protein